MRVRSPLVAEKFFHGVDESRDGVDENLDTVDENRDTVGAETVVSGGASRVLVAPSVCSPLMKRKGRVLKTCRVLLQSMW